MFCYSIPHKRVRKILREKGLDNLVQSIERGRKGYCAYRGDKNKGKEIGLRCIEVPSLLNKGMLLRLWIKFQLMTIALVKGYQWNFKLLRDDSVLWRNNAEGLRLVLGCENPGYVLSKLSYLEPRLLKALFANDAMLFKKIIRENSPGAIFYELGSVTNELRNKLLENGEKELNEVFSNRYSYGALLEKGCEIKVDIGAWPKGLNDDLRKALNGSNSAELIQKEMYPGYILYLVSQLNDRTREAVTDNECTLLEQILHCIYPAGVLSKLKGLREGVQEGLLANEAIILTRVLTYEDSLDILRLVDEHPELLDHPELKKIMYSNDMYLQLSLILENKKEACIKANRE